VTLKRVKWYALAGMVVFVVILEVTRHLLYPYMLSLPGRLLTDGMLVVVALFFFGASFQIIDTMQQQLERQNRELIALREAGLDIAAELAIDTVLQKVVDQARNLLASRYGALAVYDEGGAIETFATSGISPEVRHQIGSPPRGRGLLAVVLEEGQHLRLQDLGRDPRIVGCPANPPPMRSLRAVPIVCKGPFRGNLYLADKVDGAAFDEADEETLGRFAIQAAIAIDNAYLHDKVAELAAAEERLSLAHEMHDGLAQLLAYVNTKAQAVQEYLRSGRTTEASTQLNQLAAAAREVYGDVREGILGLRASAAPSSSFTATIGSYVRQWTAQTGIDTELELPEDLRVPPRLELQLLRIVQEGLANIRKHARAKWAHIRLTSENGRVRLEIADDGLGFNPEAMGRSEFPRFGLTTMRERAESLGGTLKLETAPGQGTRVVADIPFVRS